METAIAAAVVLRDELLLFAGLGLLIGGLDDLLLDLIFGIRWLWRAAFVYSRVPRMTAQELPPPGATGPLAVLIPAWDESAVIDQMVRGCLDKWRGEQVHLFIGAYLNDPATLRLLSRLAEGIGRGRMSIVINPRPGPTTKADCLNQLWAGLLEREVEAGCRFIAVILHDAEDVVHRDALRLIGFLAPRFALVQLPVLPLVNARSRWIAGHYCDEFAEAHGKSLTVREALGASLPSAGVGCGFNREAIGRIADAHDQRPFDAASLTEDYEMGLRLADSGGQGILVRMRDADGGLIATREYFPDSFMAAVRQKTRWTIGIALAGWDRLGWRGSWREYWMRMRDRRALLAAIILITAYAGLLLTVMLWMFDRLGLAAQIAPSPAIAPLMSATLVMLGWRIFVRMLFVGHAYGPLEALLSLPRAVVANVIAIVSAVRAAKQYAGHLRGEGLAWDKTAHRFPDADEGAGST